MRKVENIQAKQTSSSIKDILLILLAVLVFAIAGFSGFYVWKAQQYRDAFFLNTTINGLNASGKNVEEVKALINSGIEGYQLEIQGRNEQREYLAGETIDLHSTFDGTLEQIIASQKPYTWGLYFFRERAYQIETMISYDLQQLESVLSSMAILDPDLADMPENAYLSEYISGQGFEIIPEKEGTLADPVIAGEGIRQALLNLKFSVSLEELGAYIPPEIRYTDEYLNEQKEQRNQFIHITITHQFGEQSEVLDGEMIHTWLTFHEAGVVTLDEEAVAEYVAILAKDYNTAYQPKTLKTSYGDTVTIASGNYGWRINQSAETAAICEIIRSAESQIREPIYSQTAASHGEFDYGNTYVEINLTAQHLYFYKNGSLVVESDFVSGNESKGWSTPTGAYPLTYKQRNATLKGEGYSTPVSYWMPFNGGVGLHDANWRASFGGTIYKTNGSHGCINLPPAVAKTIYENLSAGDPVLCYHLDKTVGTGGSSVVPEETTAAVPETLPAETEPSQEVTETVPEETATETSAAESATAPESEYPVITPPGQENTTAAETAVSEPAVTEPSATEELPVIGPGGVHYESEPEVGPGVS